VSALPSSPPGTPAVAPRLTRPRDDRIVAGVAAGIARYLRVDPLVVRLVVLVLVLAGGGGVVAYAVAWILMPEDPEDGDPPPAAPRDAGTVAGAAMVVVGAVLLLQRLAPAVTWRFVAPLVLVAAGLLLLARGRSPR
jgi:phage shock protein PspC (stress-responsive transcriptional regulator)